MAAKRNKVIITCAVTGAVHVPSQSEYLPITPEQIAENGPIAVQAVLKSMRVTREMPEKLGLAYELEIGQPVFATDDAMEGPTAFAEKRKPNFQGR